LKLFRLRDMFWWFFFIVCLFGFFCLFLLGFLFVCLVFFLAAFFVCLFVGLFCFFFHFARKKSIHKLQSEETKQHQCESINKIETNLY
jgi:ABC-type bacteriocin/lantibiotic exporter with double-glycine peptidase domain